MTRCELHDLTEELDEQRARFDRNANPRALTRRGSHGGMLTGRNRVVSMACALSFLCVPATMNCQTTPPLIRGVTMDSKEMEDSLSPSFWRAVANAPCPSIRWKPNYLNEATFRTSTQPLRDRLSREVGALRQPAGTPLTRRSIFQGPRYSIEMVSYSSRLGSTSFGYLARPAGLAQASAPVLLIHGSGMLPQSAFDWQFPDQAAAEKRFDSTAFVGAGLELVEAGYTVLSLWLADDALDNYWPRAPWESLNRAGTLLGAKNHGRGTYYIVAQDVAGALDFLRGAEGVDPNKLSIVGWHEGAQIAAVVASIYSDVRAVVQLRAPLDLRPLRATVLGVLSESAFTHIDCSLGDVEMAALVARPMLFAYSLKDLSVSHLSAFVSPMAGLQIRTMYASLPNKPMFAVQADSTWSIEKNMRKVRFWLDSALAFTPRDVPLTISTPRYSPGERYRNSFIDSTLVQRRQFVASLGACTSPAITPDFRSIPLYTASIEPLRKRVAQVLRVPSTANPTFRIIRRETVMQRAKYAVEYVEFSSNRTSIVISGLLATPYVSTPLLGSPAVISMDGDYGLAGPLGLKGREKFPYLNQYADDLASNGTVVFVPYSPVSFPEVAATVLRARNPDGPTGWSFLIPVYQAAVDFTISLPSVDSTRIGIWGISYSAYPALFTAALDQRVTALMFSNPVLTYDRLFESPDAAALAAWFGEICSVIEPSLRYLIAPRRLVRENGARDANGYEDFPLESIVRIREVYSALGLRSQFQFARHQGGHETLPRSIF
ncbi:MAG: hypothetical protein JWM95_534 [Gemmatimonadetes bacterium]|nr:hypothetical protein [Gemmatimonadota bacterium]